MALTGNKGEWSEIYALFKLLGEGVVYAGNQDLERIQDLFYPILRILRRDQENIDFCREESLVIIQTPEGEELMRIPATVFLAQAENLLIAIRQGKSAFPVPAAESFMKSIHCHTLKAKSSDKTDIRIVLHDRRTRLNSEMGFSIKSQLGGKSTLLNASKATNFSFKIVDTQLSDKEIEIINAIDTKAKVLDRIKAIKQHGGRLVFDRIDNATFAGNLTMLDGDLPRLLSHVLLTQSETEQNMLKVLVQKLAESNPLGYNTRQPSSFYEYKIKHLLTATALGMMPATPWTGKFDANGGYLVVKQDGEILCYHFYDRNRFEDYLFANAFLERSDTSRHEYASIVKNTDGSLSFKLNLQIRLK